MAKRKLTAKQEAFVKYFADPGSETYNNITQSMIKAGYTKEYASNNTNQVMGNNGVKEAVATYKAKTAEKLDWNRDIALKHLRFVIDSLEKQVAAGNTGAVNAYIRAVTEFNAISNLHSSTVTTHTQEPDQLTDDEMAELKRMAILATNLKTRKSQKQA